MISYKTFICDTSAEWVVFVHGAGGSSKVWFKQIRDFNKRYNILMVDLRGHGDSADITQEKKQNTPDVYKKYTIEQIASEVIEVVDYLNIKECHFVGLSLGGIVIRQITETHLHLVKTMTLAGAVLKFNVRSKILSFLVDKLKRFVPFIWVYRLYAKIMMPSKKSMESRKLFVKEAKKIKRVEALNWLALNKGISKLLKRYWEIEPPIPTLYVMGEHDYIFLSQVKLYYHGHHDYSKLVIIPYVGHVCNIEAPSIFNEVVLSFLEAHPIEGLVKDNAGDSSQNNK